MTSKSSRQNKNYLRDLLETDNTLRDLLANLKQMVSKIMIVGEPTILLQDDEFIKKLFVNLTSTFKCFDKINEFMEFDERKVDDLIMEIIDILNDVQDL